MGENDSMNSHWLAEIEKKRMTYDGVLCSIAAVRRQLTQATEIDVTTLCESLDQVAELEKILIIGMKAKAAAENHD